MTYGAQIWRTSKNTNIIIIQRLQSKILRSISNAYIYTPNGDVHRGLNIPTVKEEILNISQKHHDRLLLRTNDEIHKTLTREATTARRLQETRPTDLFFV